MRRQASFLPSFCASAGCYHEAEADLIEHHARIYAPLPAH